MDLTNFDPGSMGIPSGSMSDILMGVMLVVYFGFFIGAFFFIMRYKQYKIPVEIYSKEGTAIIQTKTTKAREVTSLKGSEYELLSSLFKPTTKKEFFRIDSEEYKIPSRKGYIFKLITTGFNDYHPIKISNPDVRFTIIPQNNTSWFASKLRQIHTKFKNPTIWNHPAIYPMAIITFGIIQLIIVMMTLEKAGEVNSSCQTASNKITSAISQRLA